MQNNADPAVQSSHTLYSIFFPFIYEGFRNKMVCAGVCVCNSEGWMATFSNAAAVCVMAVVETVLPDLDCEKNVHFLMNHVLDTSQSFVKVTLFFIYRTKSERNFKLDLYKLW